MSSEPVSRNVILYVPDEGIQTDLSYLQAFFRVENDSQRQKMTKSDPIITGLRDNAFYILQFNNAGRPDPMIPDTDMDIERFIESAPVNLLYAARLGLGSSLEVLYGQSSAHEYFSTLRHVLGSLCV